MGVYTKGKDRETLIRELSEGHAEEISESLKKPDDEFGNGRFLAEDPVCGCGCTYYYTPEEFADRLIEADEVNGG